MLHPAVTLVVGPNASGKTNLLESLYVLASTKSFRAHDRDLVRHGHDHFRVVAKSDETEFALGMSVAGGIVEKKVTHDGAKRTLSAHVGAIQVTIFEPTDLELVAGPPEARRRYLDFVLCQTDGTYLKTLQQYRRVLKQRNALLDGYDVAQVRQQIFTWDVAMAELATEIYRRRIALIELLNTLVPEQYSDIAGTGIDIRLDYLPSVGGDYSESYLEVLNANLGRDMAAGFTTIGPHREDFKVQFKNNDINAVASRGEVRTVVLAMKLSELVYAESQTGIKPIFLLDDVFSELDRDRRRYLLERVAGYQAIFTTTDADSIAGDLSMSHAVIATGNTADVGR